MSVEENHWDIFKKSFETWSYYKRSYYKRFLYWSINNDKYITAKI